MSPSSLDGYAHVRDYPYRDPDGRVLFIKRRYEALDPISGLRSKTFRYYDPATRKLRKPPGADGYLYRLDEVVRGIARRRTVHWSEGEKDSDALAQEGSLATSHHQGAGRVSLAQAAWLRGARRIVLWVDRDTPPAVGAYDAVVRYNLLIDVGVSPETIRMVCARSGKDAFDHLEAGHTVARAVKLHPQHVLDVARDYTGTQARRIGYRHG